jgi:glyoxylase-like metal-dependent hydrolase (beta-lactamase superfamily II)
MRIRTPGKVSNNLWYLGGKESGIYLLEGRDTSMIISGGISYIVPDILRQFEEFGIDEGRIDKLLILHAHYDHVGVVPFFQRRYPDLRIYASRRAWELLNEEKVIETVNMFGKLTAERMGYGNVVSSYDLDWRDDVKGITVFEGDTIDLGRMSVYILETPGHSSCSITAYVPEMRTLFPSDACGIPFKEDTLIISGNSNYTLFQQSLEKLNTLEVDCLCADHYGYVTGEEAHTHIAHSIDEAKRFRKLMESVYRRTGDVQTAAKRMVAATLSSHSDYFIPREVLEGVYTQIIRHLAKEMEKEILITG